MSIRYFLYMWAGFFPFPVYAQGIDTENSTVTFEIRNIGINTVRGSFGGIEGMVLFDPQEPEKGTFDVCIDVSTIDTGIGLRDRDLKGESFFHVEQYPEICFESESIRKQDEVYLTTGKLSMAGVTRDEKIPFTYTNGIFEGTFTLNRFDYGVGENVSKFVAGEEVTVSIVCVTE
jgi:polyisoprenoid-binding protein YceI